VRVLSEGSNYNIDRVIKAGYDTRLAGFEILVPALVKTFGLTVHGNDTLYNKLYEPIGILRDWDFRCDENSIATTLAIEWGQKISPFLNRAAGADQVERAKALAAALGPNDLLMPFVAAINDLNSKYGKWKIAWGEINRFQRISSDIDNKFDDNKPSIPVGFVSSTWGMLPSYTSRIYPGTKKRYGENGNSFICAVEFGKKIKAKSLLAGGESGDENSKHFFDQAEMYSKGQFKDVFFYKEDVMKHVEKSYHPGE
jgi:acyl-homoserine lactone acylase PvdQ